MNVVYIVKVGFRNNIEVNTVYDYAGIYTSLADAEALVEELRYTREWYGNTIVWIGMEAIPTNTRLGFSITFEEEEEIPFLED